MDATGEPATKVIHLWIEQGEPLSGTAADDEGPPVPFEGWVELLGVVSELIGAPARPGEAQRASRVAT